MYEAQNKNMLRINRLRTLSRLSVCRFTFRNYLKKRKCLEVPNEICIILFNVGAIRLQFARMVYVYCLAQFRVTQQQNPLYGIRILISQ